MLHRLTYPKGVHSFRYFPYVNCFVICSCIYAFCLRITIRHSMRTPKYMHWVSIAIRFLSRFTLISGVTQIPGKTEDPRKISLPVEEVPEWVYAFWVCKLVLTLGHLLHCRFFSSILHNRPAYHNWHIIVTWCWCAHNVQRLTITFCMRQWVDSIYYW